MAPRKSSSLAGLNGRLLRKTKDLTSSSWAWWCGWSQCSPGPWSCPWWSWPVVGVEEIGVEIELGVEVEALEVEHLRHRRLAEVHRALRRARVHVLEAVHQRVDLVRRHQVGLADEDLVGEADLAARLLARVELAFGVLGVDQGQDGVEQVALGDLVVHEEGLRHRAGVGQAGGLDDHALEVELALAPLLGQVGSVRAQVLADRAADAAVVHLDDLLAGVGDQDVVVDVLLAELVLDDGDLLAVGLGQHALEQRRLARAEKAGEDGGGDEAWVHVGSASTSDRGVRWGSRTVLQGPGNVKAGPWPAAAGAAVRARTRPAAAAAARGRAPAAAPPSAP